MKIAELYLQTVSPSALHDFYADALGLPILESTPDRLSVRVGASRMTFIRGDAKRYHFAFDVPSNQFHEAVSWLKARTTIIGKADNETFTSSGWHAQMVYFYDPAGNVLELIARHNLKQTSNHPFDSNSLLNISEIGLSTPDVQALVSELQGKFGYDVYDGVNNPDFCALGDEHGLFIIVKQGRTWMPDTGVPAELDPVTVVVEHHRSVNFTSEHLPYRVTTQVTTL